MNSKFFIGGIAALALILSVVALIGGNQSKSFSGVTTGTAFPHGVTIGSPYIPAGTSPTNIALYEQGTCTIVTYGTIVATSTGSVDCPITDALPGDLIQLRLAASTTLASQYLVKSSQASSTAGYATAQLVNLTGATANPASTVGFGSSTIYQLWRSQ